MFLAALDQSIVGTAIRTIADDLNGFDAGLGDHGLPDHLDDHDADLRQARRPLRPQEAVPVRDHRLHHRLRRLLVRDLDVQPGRTARPAGPRRRRAVHRWCWRSSATSCRRASGRSTPATSWPSSPPRACSAGRRRAVRRPGDDPRHRRLALGLPRERADRHRGAGRGRRGTCTCTTCGARPGSTGGAPSRWSSAVAPLLVVAEQGRIWGWGSSRSLTCFAIGLVGIAAFILAEHRMRDDALIPLRIFRLRAASRS